MARLPGCQAVRVRVVHDFRGQLACWLDTVVDHRKRRPARRGGSTPGLDHSYPSGGQAPAGVLGEKLPCNSSGVCRVARRGHPATHRARGSKSRVNWLMECLGPPMRFLGRRVALLMSWRLRRFGLSAARSRVLAILRNTGRLAITSLVRRQPRCQQPSISDRSF